ncbi:hypothetical protein CK203_097149 [Vitis vinifera]|uniref:Uncharacterized protein n=1 Tax=Vitis vinifera TaxID=29760 RepID=A0A438CG21_VITVI|nr:hypothetical protein CK203_097149 [Vitis vinifera]
MNRLAPLSEEPTNDEEEDNNNSSKKVSSWRNWLKSHFSLLFNKKSDLKILLSVLGCPLFPISPHAGQPNTHVSFVVGGVHNTAFHGGDRLPETGGKVKNVFATGKVRMAMVDELGSSGSSTAVGPTGVSQKGCFVMWQMVPDKWLIELVVGGHKVVAGSDGNVAWRHTPWIGAHAAKGGVRPLRRVLQIQSKPQNSGYLLPFFLPKSQHTWDWTHWRYQLCSPQPNTWGEANHGRRLLRLEIVSRSHDLADRSDNTAEMIKHVIFGYFSQRSGLLVYLEDSYLTRIQSPGSRPTYWETTMATKIEDYRTVEGVMIAHGGQSSAIITRFGDNLKVGPAITRMEETWTIDDLAFNVPGLSMDCFIPPEEVQKDYPEENLDWRSPLHR